jgi:hypothetical protein
MRLFPILALPLLSASLAIGPAPLKAQSAAPGAEAQQVIPDGRLAAEAPEVQALFEAMGLYSILEVMAAEGNASAAEIETDMFPGQGGSAWRAVVASIYSADRLATRFEQAVTLDAMTPEVIEQLQAFYDTDLGARVAAGEIAARQAFLDPGVEEAATELALERMGENDPRIAQLTEFIAVNDLVDRNVSGALNSNFAFYRSLSDGGAFASEIPEQLMLAEVWGQEAEIRASTTEWLYAYQLLAYDDLSAAEMESYIEMTSSEAGQVLNTVLFHAFDVLFESISTDLGAAAARFIAGEET